MKPKIPRRPGGVTPINRIGSRAECYRVLDACKTEDEFLRVRERVAEWILRSWLAPLDEAWAREVAHDLWAVPEWRVPAGPDDG